MTTTRLATLAASLLAGAVLALPAAAGNVPRMSDQRVGLACALVGTGECPDVTLAANEPFFVAHGAEGEPIADLLGPERRFELSVDGRQVHGAIDLDLDSRTGVGSKIYVFDFPRGLAGTHTFTGCWYDADGSLTTCGTRVAQFA